MLDGAAMERGNWSGSLGSLGMEAIVNVVDLHVISLQSAALSAGVQSFPFAPTLIQHRSAYFGKLVIASGIFTYQCCGCLMETFSCWV